MTALVLYGDTDRDASLRHEVPIAIGDAFMLIEDHGKTWILSSGLEHQRLAECRPDAELVQMEDLGLYQLLGSGITRNQIDLELASRFVAHTKIAEAVVSFDFPLAVGERLRGDGLGIQIDDEAIALRRRRKSEPELAGIRRAQVAAEAAISTAAALLRRAEADGDALSLDGSPLTAEMIRAAMTDTAWEHGTLLPPEVIVSSVWQGVGHDPGSGRLPAGLPITVDVWPRDLESDCWADMTRTFLVCGEAPEETLRQERLCRQALEDTYAAVRPGVTGRELYDHCCDLFEAEGYATQRTGRGDDPEDGFQFSLGHGVGLRVHEAPGLGRTGTQPLVPGDVLAIEPGLRRSDVGMVRFEDLVLVTDDGCELMTDHSYELTP